MLLSFRIWRAALFLESLNKVWRRLASVGLFCSLVLCGWGDLWLGRFEAGLGILLPEVVFDIPLPFSSTADARSSQTLLNLPKSEADEILLDQILTKSVTFSTSEFGWNGISSDDVTGTDESTTVSPIKETLASISESTVWEVGESGTGE